jgi:hypothetical protein
LGGDTLNRKWWLDYNSGTHAAPVWVPVNGVSDFKFGYTPTMQDDSDFDSAGAKSQGTTAYEWVLECKLQRKVTIADETVYDTGQEYIRAAAKRKIGMANVIEVRWYEMNIDDDGTVIGPTEEAYMGYVNAGWGEEGGGMDALDTVSVALSGRGAYEDITHPEAAAVVPTVYSVTPATDVAAGGAAVLIQGHDFMVAGVDDVVAISFGAVDAPDFTTVSDGLIAVTVPAGTGAVNVTVENATGVSVNTVPFLYT